MNDQTDADFWNIRLKAPQLKDEIERLRTQVYGPTGLAWKDVALERLALLNTARTEIERLKAGNATLTAELAETKLALADRQRGSDCMLKERSEMDRKIVALKAELATSINSVCQLTGRLDEVLAEARADTERICIAAADVLKWLPEGQSFRSIRLSDGAAQRLKAACEALSDAIDPARQATAPAARP